MKKYIYNSDVFFRMDALSYYLLGAYIADGCIVDDSGCLRISISSKDENWINIIRDLICKDKSLTKYNNCYRFIINSNKIGNWFIDNKCIQNKSLVVEVPNVPLEYMPDFVRGCWDGDGSVSFTKRYRKDRNNFEQCRRAKITSGSSNFIESIFSYLTSIGIKGTIQVNQPKKSFLKNENRIIQSNHNNYEIHLSNGFKVYNFCKKIYFKNSCLSMPRKQSIANEIIKDWEREFRCEICNILLNLDKYSRRTKFCVNCYKAKLKK